MSAIIFYVRHCSRICTRAASTCVRRLGYVKKLSCNQTPCAILQFIHFCKTKQKMFKFNFQPLQDNVDDCFAEKGKMKQWHCISNIHFKNHVALFQIQQPPPNAPIPSRVNWQMMSILSKNAKKFRRIRINSDTISLRKMTKTIIK